MKGQKFVVLLQDDDIVLLEWDEKFNQRYSTHQVTELDEIIWGHYFDDPVKAAVDFARRAKDNRIEKRRAKNEGE